MNERAALKLELLELIHKLRVKHSTDPMAQFAKSPREVIWEGIVTGELPAQLAVELGLAKAVANEQEAGVPTLAASQDVQAEGPPVLRSSGTGSTTSH